MIPRFLHALFTQTCFIQLAFLLLQVYDGGSIFHPSVLDITDEDIRSKFIEGAAIVTMTCLGIGYPTPASVPHMVSNAFK